MSVSRERIERNLVKVRERIAQAAARAGRSVNDIRTVAVTKNVGLEEANALLDLGLTHLGENRVEDAREKIKALGDAAEWHMIGNIQRRKVPSVIELFDRIDAVDRMSLANELEKRCAESGRSVSVLIQVNVSGEASKHGFSLEDFHGALDAIRNLPHLKVEGLMTMAPLAASEEGCRGTFATLRKLGEEAGLETLSMGMTNDFELAIEEGATEVRIGSALFN